MRFALVARRSTPTNDALAAAGRGDVLWKTMAPEEALEELRTGDVALGRLDVLPTLDGVDDGLWALGALAARGVTMLNEAAALLGTHDKLLTARLLRRSGIPHPSTLHVRPDRPFPAVRTPVVVKPRFGSWGREVRLCDDDVSFVATLESLRDASWFRQQGALVQELVPPQGYDLRILVAGERTVGAVFRVAAAGEWRTNISLGGVRRPVSELPREACTIALAAASASGASLVGVDLLPDAQGGWTVVELNGAVEFTHEYVASGDIFADVSLELARAAVGGPVDVDSLASAVA
jgi:[lysine-biosynthesis-protein LysW]--L-2-aminoadipate ligase